ncbi:hypothetical protein [Streptomyces sp. NPDC046197]|uniref:hypothetical protein n=1 Tax=Streptomyces sp. NPDC046197 TaxID=3154337 RepID=UPI0033C164EB
MNGQGAGVLEGKKNSGFSAAPESEKSEAERFEDGRLDAEPGKSSLGEDIGRWIGFTFCFGAAPVWLTILNLPSADKWSEICERGDLFIIAAAFVAPEIPGTVSALNNGKRVVYTYLLTAMVVLVAVCMGFAALTAQNFTITHPEVPTTKPSTLAAPQGVNSTSIFTRHIATVSVLCLLISVALVLLGLFLRSEAGLKKRWTR